MGSECNNTIIKQVVSISEAAIYEPESHDKNTNQKGADLIKLKTSVRVALADTHMM